MARMVRKQIYITGEQEQLLKRRSAELGLSEAELIRRSLEVALGRTRLAEAELLASAPGDREALRALLAFAESRVGMTVPPSEWKFSREELYEERLGRWGRPQDS